MDLSSNDSKQVDLIQCDSWDDFKDRVRRDEARSWISSQSREEVTQSFQVFRGHLQSGWKLSSRWERFLETLHEHLGAVQNRTGWQSVLDKILSDFKEFAIGNPALNTQAFDEVDWWALV